VCLLQVFSASAIEQQNDKMVQARRHAIEDEMITLFDLYVVEMEKAENAKVTLSL
jgi:hypothetical protein